MAMMVDVV